MRKVGLNIRLAYGHFLIVELSEHRARQIMGDWASGAFNLKGVTHISELDNYAGCWSVRVEDIVAMHTVELAQSVPSGSGLSRN